ncbi:uncharacterized protein LOC125758523 [Rhipicephalus sanguineus]|uniref:uncharacterized protein LOC125758523 n=1 Tax=Rhipicephalus sanguineus TaxID=34632 RepID=UPI0020C54D15|nr:uncharacterized protein LOC125758523 [Rhipicephalus sanguineus]
MRSDIRSSLALMQRASILQASVVAAKTGDTTQREWRQQSVLGVLDAAGASPRSPGGVTHELSRAQLSSHEQRQLRTGSGAGGGGHPSSSSRQSRQHSPLDPSSAAGRDTQHHHRSQGDLSSLGSSTFSGLERCGPLVQPVAPAHGLDYQSDSSSEWHRKQVLQAVYVLECFLGVAFSSEKPLRKGKACGYVSSPR